MGQAASTPESAATSGLSPLDSMGEMLLTTGEVARYLRVSINTVHRLADSGDLPSSKVGRLRRFRPADVKAYVERADGATGPKPLRAASL